MSLSDLGMEGFVSRTLLIDGDIAIYQPCCVFNEDSDIDRKQIKKLISNKISKLMEIAECDTYIMFVTTKFNFRDDLVSDYKLNRINVERPVNLAWAKRWAADNLNTHYHRKLEADDLLGIHMTKDSVIWSLDKDLRQIPGKHIDNATEEVIEIDEFGVIRPKGNSYYFTGTIGLYFQMLTGDPTDYIVGCGKRVPSVYKSGAKIGQSYIRRKGVGAKEAYNILLGGILKGTPKLLAGRTKDSLSSIQYNELRLKAAKYAVGREYGKLHGSNWLKELETQANLLFMVREQHGEVIKRWTYDNRDEYFDLIEGKILNDFTP